MHKLDKIIANTRAEVAKRKQITPEAMLYLQLSERPVTNSFYRALSSSPAGAVLLIAEIKHASPSNGAFQSSLSVKERLYQYQSAGADALSYVSDAKFFGGSLTELAEICAAASVPVLQKDFIITLYQLVEAAIASVDAILLIARVLDSKELKSFVNFAQLNAIEPVVEVYNEEDLEQALATDTRIIGVNARDLDTFTIDKERACQLISQVPQDRLCIAFSGVQSTDDVRQYCKAGARAVLVGSTLMKSNTIAKTIATLKTP